jgi:hypothetical protein
MERRRDTQVHAKTGLWRVWVAGQAIDVWENPQVSFSWTPGAIRSYLDAEQWESAFNALVLFARVDPRELA